MEAWIIKVVFTACFAFGLAIFNKYWDPIAAHIGYPFSVGINLVELGGKVKLLSEKQSDFSSCYPNRSSLEESKGWLSRVEDLVKKEKELKERYAKCGLLSYLSLCHVGKDVETELKKANELITQGDRLLANVKALPLTLHDVQPRDQPVPGTFPGMDKPYGKVLKFIKDRRSNSVIMGVWGMGGVGKTTLIERVRKARSDQYAKCFKIVLFVHAGKSGSTVSHLQKVISSRMGLAPHDVEKSQEGFIHDLLHDKDFLLLVDDLYQPINLEEVGIPSLQPVENRYQRKIVFTTRSEKVCTHMKFPNSKDIIINMKCLNKKDAWDLFAQKVENSILQRKEIRELAEKIVEECSGLPMALCTIGKSMSGKIDSAEWIIAEQELKMSLFHEISRNHEDLFMCLKESYYNLSDDKEKERFLLCSLWPENKNIPMKKLTRWLNGHGLLHRFCNASDSGYTLINVLVSASLLEKGDTCLDSTENSHVKMHSMVRKMALRIVNEHSYKWLPNSLHRQALEEADWLTLEKAWVSKEDASILHECSSQTGFPENFPELKMLVANQHEFSFELISFFRNITFLDLEGVTLKKNQSDKCPWEIICKLIELQHLNLSGTSLGSLSLVLIALSKLKYLYIRNNMDLQAIPGGLIIALKTLRGLDLFCTGASFPDVLNDLASSSIKLDMLGFTVQTVAQIEKLEKLKSSVCTQALSMHDFKEDTINLELLSNLEQLRELAIKTSSHIVKLLVPGGDPEHDQPLLRRLQFIALESLLNLEKVIWVNAGMDIRVVNVSNCNKLRDVTWVRHLKCLEQLTVAHCQEMEILIETGESSQGASLTQIGAVRFGQLKKIILEELPKLSMISQQSCVFKDLSYISVTGCSEMKGIHEQNYEQFIKINCSEDWWKKNTFKKSNDKLVPTFAPSRPKSK